MWLLFVLVSCASADVIAQTIYGPIMGLSLPSGNSSYRRFQGVPFARPPLPPFRWKAPAPPGNWTNPLDCRNFTIGCAQTADSMDVPKNKSEDCLYLEVFAPPVGKFSEPAAIILWFHGGDWHEGGESFEIYNGAHHAAHLNTMVVITNYRLVALGFLLPHPKCGDANVGILDQRMAIKWIHDNAAFFGADPNKLTLAGQSAGGESVLIHLSNPQNEVASMFHAAISESGPLPMNFKYLPEARTLGRSFSVELGCFSPDDCACFQSKNTSQVLKASNNVINVPLSVSDAIQQWAPVIDGVSIAREPVEAFQSGQFVKVPFIGGMNSRDGMLFSWAIADSKKLPSDEYIALVTGIFNEDLHLLPDIFLEYPPSLFGDNKEVFMEVINDYLFLCSLRFSLRQAELAGMSTFSYYFRAVPPACPWPKSQQYCCNSSCHGDEIVYVFHDVGAPFPWTFPPEHVALADTMSSMWADLAHGRAPAGWPVWRNATQQTIVFDVPNVSTTQFLRKKQCDLWDRVGYSNERQGPLVKLARMAVEMRKAGIVLAGKGK